MQRLSDLAASLRVPPSEQDAEYARVVTDSRAVQTGDLFVALRGERFDAHDFLAEAAARGAAGAVVERALPLGLPQLVVGDALLALQEMAQAWRARFCAPLIAVTGSNGKTTTKQLLAALCAARGPVLATRGNLNNHIGVPLTLLELRAEHRSAVVEMGANRAGEIARLAQLARPYVAVITQAGDAHLEGFGSRAGVARAKGELFEVLGSEGIAVINADDAYAPLWRDLARGRQISFGIEADADVRAQDLDVGAQGSRFTLHLPGSRAVVQLPLPGRHNVMNALAAAGCGAALGMDASLIAQQFAQVQPAQGRVDWKLALSGARVIDDSYNANPDSMRAGLDLLAQQPPPRWAVLGAMAELGVQAAQLHEDCGRHARERGIEHLLALGAHAQDYARGYGVAAQTYEEIEPLMARLNADVNDAATVLVKGSRSARMERVVHALCGAHEQGSH